jgi:hypothetical protein
MLAEEEKLKKKEIEGVALKMIECTSEESPYV